MNFPTTRALALLCVGLSSTAFAADKIPLAPWMIVSESCQTNYTYANGGPATWLVDEQAAVGDPLNDGSVAPLRYWFPGWASSGARYPASAIIDLRAEYALTDIMIYDGEGGSLLAVYAGEPFAWDTAPLFTDPMTIYPARWKRKEVSVTTRYLRVSLAGPGAAPTEIVVYGTIVPGQTPEPEPPAVPHRRSTIDELIGTNAFIDDPIGVIEQVGNVREYHNWPWDEGNGDVTYPGYPNNLNGWSPSWVGWDFDAYYRNLHRLGLIATPVIWQTPEWMRGTGDDGEMRPIPLGDDGASTRDSLDPASYVEHADHLFQFAARYGAESIPDGLLKLRDNQPRLSGQGLLRYYENWNEQDKWWRGQESYFTPFEFAAMTSADWDGHLGTMGDTFGIANADPAARLVMGGLAIPDPEYLRAMNFWFRHRRGDMPLAAINVHHYCNDAGGQAGEATIGISPEADGLRERFTALADFRDRYMPECELWMTEFGWDIDERSIQRAPQIAGLSAEEVQGRWIARTWLEFAAAGVDRAHQYMMRDVGFPGTVNAGVRFSTSGLVGPKGDWTPRASFFYQATLRQRLRGLRFYDELPATPDEIRQYRLSDDTGRIRAIAVWSPTAEDRVIADVSVPVPDGTTRVTQVALVDGLLGGELTELGIGSGHVSVTVDEKPKLLLLEGRNVRTRLPDRRLILSPLQVIKESGSASGDPTMLVDEQANVGNPDFGKGARLTSPWNPGWFESNYPAIARIDLGLQRRITKVYINDHDGFGDFITETGQPGEWHFLALNNLKGSGGWHGHVTDGRPMRQVRFTATVRGANVAEVALYAREYSGYGDWAERAFPGTEDFGSGNAAPLADPDGDGVKNLFEYAFGGEALAAEPDLLPTPVVGTDKITLTYARDLLLKDIAWQVEWSTDLTMWHTDGVTETVELATPDLERRRAEVAIKGETRTFLRLKVTLTAAP